MRNNGLFALIWIVFANVRDGFGARQAWKIVLMLLAVLAIPFVLIGVLVALIF